MKRIWALIPLKDFACAKSRLASALDVEDRRALTMAMAFDVATALMRSQTVARVIMVSDIPELNKLMGINGLGHFDTQQSQGLNEDLTTAAAWACGQGATHMLIAHADLPCLTPHAIDRFLLEAKDSPTSRMRAAACKEGSGTNLLLAPLPLALPLVFGKNSLARFCQNAAAVDIAIDVVHDASLAADIDEPEDFRALTQACTRGDLAGQATADLLLSLAPPHPSDTPFEPDVWPTRIWHYAIRQDLPAIKKHAHG